MKNIILFASALFMTACTPVYLTNAPGAPLPGAFIAFCKGHDEAGRRNNWSTNSKDCINPKGIDAKPPIFPCSSIKKEK